VVLQFTAEQTVWTPRSLRNSAEQEHRRNLLAAPHMAPLTDYARGLRHRPGCEVPDFDPCDGGIDAQLLFLFEKPGPMTAAAGEHRGSGFISRDNDDPTAEATGRFMVTAGIPRAATVLWNAIPWWNGTIAIDAAERRAGLKEIEALHRLLPKLCGVVLVGRKAELAEPALRRLGSMVFRSPHPSPRVRAAFPEKWSSIPDQWRQAYAQSAAA
jgi:hypothetical protein